MSKYIVNPIENDIYYYHHKKQDFYKSKIKRNKEGKTFKEVLKELCEK